MYEVSAPITMGITSIIYSFCFPFLLNMRVNLFRLAFTSNAISQLAPSISFLYFIANSSHITLSVNYLILT